MSAGELHGRLVDGDPARTRSCTWRRGPGFGPASPILGSTPTSTSWGRSRGSRRRAGSSRGRGSFTRRAPASTASGRKVLFVNPTRLICPSARMRQPRGACGAAAAHVSSPCTGLPVTGLRFFTAYGPRFNRPDLAIAKFTRLIDQGLPVPMFGDGTSRRDYTYVDDIVDGIVRAIERGAAHHLYNLGHSKPVALRDLIDLIARALGTTAHIEALPEQPGDVPQTFAAIDRAADELGYAPKTAFPDGLRRYIAWYRSHKAAAGQSMED